MPNYALLVDQVDAVGMKYWVLQSATFDYGGKWDATKMLLVSTEVQGKTTGAHYNVRENYWSNIWGD